MALESGNRLPTHAVIEAWDASESDGTQYRDVIVWASEADAKNDDGLRAIARYKVNV